MTFPHEATYSAEDDKLRIYFSFRLDREDYQRVIDLGFRQAPKQGCHFATWSPAREDYALEMAGEITGEGTTLAERAAAKASRLDELARKNAHKANCFQYAATSISERFAHGQPILVGHHSERKARRDQARMDSAMNQAARCAGMVEYWNYKATSIERHANYKNYDDVRARRIKTLLAELRGHQRDINESYIAIKRWEFVETLKSDNDKFAKSVRILASYLNMSPYLKNGSSVFSQLDDGKLTPDEALELSLEHHYKVVESEIKSRWITHLLNRLAFERAELGDVERFDGELTPVVLQAFLREHGADSPKANRTETGFKAVSDAPFPLHVCSELMTEVELTSDEWRDLMQSCGYEVPKKKERKSSTSTKANVPLINPTKEDAEKLQALWNDRMAQALNEKKSVATKIATITELTQARYSSYSKGEYTPYETIELDASGKEIKEEWLRRERVKDGVPVCRIRVSTAGFEFYKAKSVIVITDKAGKALPINWEA